MPSTETHAGEAANEKKENVLQHFLTFQQFNLL